jgi:hypothetical protein
MPRQKSLKSNEYSTQIGANPGDVHVVLDALAQRCEALAVLVGEEQQRRPGVEAPPGSLLRGRQRGRRKARNPGRKRQRRSAARATARRSRCRGAEEA